MSAVTESDVLMAMRAAYLGVPPFGTYAENDGATWQPWGRSESWRWEPLNLLAMGKGRPSGELTLTPPA
jgi:hypothetical protein